MTTKEKALSLYHSFSNKANSFIEGKRCALLCVEEILKIEHTDYWREVKQEIENL